MSIQRKLKIVIVSWYFPNLFENGSTHGKSQNIELALSELPSLKIIAKKEQPHLNYYLVLDEKNKEVFYNELTKAILNRFENVATIDMDSYSQKIYSSDLSKEIGNWLKIFDIPAGENNRKVHKQKNYNKYFKRELFEQSGKERKPFLSDYIGFTGKSKEELAAGEELKCELLFRNSREYRNEYIFVRNISKVLKKWATGPISEYFIIPNDFLLQAQNEIEKLLKIYPNIIEIKVPSKLYDESIKAFELDATDNLKFERSIEYFFFLSYKTDLGVRLIKTPKTRDNRTSLESKKVGTSDYDLEELEEKYGYLDAGDDFRNDDLETDYFSHLH